MPGDGAHHPDVEWLIQGNLDGKVLEGLHGLGPYLDARGAGGIDPPQQLRGGLREHQDAGGAVDHPAPDGAPVGDGGRPGGEIRMQPGTAALAGLRRGEVAVALVGVDEEEARAEHEEVVDRHRHGHAKSVGHLGEPVEQRHRAAEGVDVLEEHLLDRHPGHQPTPFLVALVLEHQLLVAVTPVGAKLPGAKVVDQLQHWDPRRELAGYQLPAVGLGTALDDVVDDHEGAAARPGGQHPQVQELAQGPQGVALDVVGVLLEQPRVTPAQDELVAIGQRLAFLAREGAPVLVVDEQVGGQDMAVAGDLGAPTPVVLLPVASP